MTVTAAQRQWSLAPEAPMMLASIDQGRIAGHRNDRKVAVNSNKNVKKFAKNTFQIVHIVIIYMSDTLVYSRGS